MAQVQLCSDFMDMLRRLINCRIIIIIIIIIIITIIIWICYGAPILSSEAPYKLKYRLNNTTNRMMIWL